MLFQIVSLLLDVATGLLGGACLLRLYMQAQRIPFSNPVGRALFSLTDWLVLPLRRLLPALGGWDTASLVGAWLLELIQAAVLWALLGGGPDAVLLPVLATFGLARLVLTGLMVLVIMGAVLSWVRAESLSADIVERLCAPLLRPWRRILPRVGGLDLSPLAFLVALQVAGIVLAALQNAVLG